MYLTITLYIYLEDSRKMVVTVREEHFLTDLGAK